MKLPKELHDKLAGEFRIAATRMTESDSPAEKLYYFSVLFGEATRVLNWHWDTELVLIWFATQQTHNVIAGRQQSITQGEPIVRLTDAYFVALTDAVLELADYVEQEGNEQQLLEIIGKFAELAYFTTGNGYYLAQKGTFKVF
ncbi:MAG: hypothetical protein BZY79_06540 [SAR202 cluster bacterium Casp-Chloro-G4]|nr:hypothetical protein [Chloroflexota bacterium]MDA1226832.1 hypothetical protein [Chloroflexota bacterium]PKB60876.1 MAG: hypothetical protein BZY79_06540 [SAR202 cluster bacterium Casp-Chloro-G4]